MCDMDVNAEKFSWVMSRLEFDGAFVLMFDAAEAWHFSLAHFYETIDGAKNRSHKRTIAQRSLCHYGDILRSFNKGCKLYYCDGESLSECGIGLLYDIFRKMKACADSLNIQTKSPLLVSSNCVLKWAVEMQGANSKLKLCADVLSCSCGEEEVVITNYDGAKFKYLIRDCDGSNYSMGDIVYGKTGYYAVANWNK